MAIVTESDSTSAEDAGRRIATLSGRQLDCLNRASQGLSSKEIARQIGIAPSTVDTHIQAALAKLDVGNRRQAVRLIRRFWRRNGPDIQPAGTDGQNERSLIPPLGGSENRTSPLQRLQRIAIIAVLSVVVVLAFFLSIAGAVHILNR